MIIYQDGCNCWMVKTTFQAEGGEVIFETLKYQALFLGVGHWSLETIPSGNRTW